MKFTILLIQLIFLILLLFVKVPQVQASNIWCNTSAGTLNTAIGCIPILDPDEFIKFILGWVVGIGGTLAFLLIIYGGFMILSSLGNPDRLRAGQELLTSAIMGLLLLVFSVFILRVIGIDILKLPEFGQDL